MEVYTLDGLLRRAQVVDTFETCIWTERLSAFGDFELHTFSTFAMRSLLTAGTRIAVNESDRVMTVDTVENTLDSEGRTMLKIAGRSLETLLIERINRYGLTAAPANATWVLKGTPANIVRQIFDAICRNNTIHPGDNIPFLVAGSLYPKSNMAEPTDVITIELEFGTVYDSIKSICDTYKLGFRLVRNLDKSELMFDVYAGNDRTTSQSILTPIVFSPELDNLADISELTSIEAYRNVAYVFSPVASVIVYADGADETTSGFQRRVLLVDATDITYLDRPYTISKVQETAINSGINLDANTQAYRDSMNLLLQKTRLSTTDVVNINNVLLSGILSADDKLNITAARNVSTSYNATEDALIAVALTQKGKDELSKSRSLAAFDGEIPQAGSYRYKRHYELGDLVEMRNEDGITNNMRVTEQIFVSDSTGDRSYPTLAVDLYITPGSWFAWENTQVWAEVADTVYWGDGTTTTTKPTTPTTPTTNPGDGTYLMASQLSTDLSGGFAPTDNPAVFFAPHADDEALSMGLEIAEHLRLGRNVLLVLMTAGASTNTLSILNGVNTSIWGYMHDPVREEYHTKGPLTQSDISLIRQAEFRNSAGALRRVGGELRVAFGGLTDGGILVDGAKIVMRSVISKFNTASYKTMSWSDTSSDHANCGKALQELSALGEVSDVRYCVSNTSANKSAATAAGVNYVQVDASNAIVVSAAKQALRCYDGWAPSLGNYAFGRHSVGSEIDTQLSSPTQWRHL